MTGNRGNIPNAGSSPEGRSTTRVLSERESVHFFRLIVRQKQRILRQVQMRSRLGILASLTGLLSLTAGTSITAYRGKIDASVAAWLPFAVLSAATLIYLWRTNVTIPDERGWRVVNRPDAEHDLDIARDDLRFASARTHPSVTEQRLLYRDEVNEVVAEYAADSRRSRRIHNSLQGLITVGSASVTAVAALDPGLNWQKKVIIGIGLVVTIASGLSGYYKFRERSYFLQQTADSVAEEASAFTLGIGEYSEFDPNQRDLALARFTQRVEALRNEQRRRQQQLDQPAEQATSTQQVQ